MRSIEVYENDLFERNIIIENHALPQEIKGACFKFKNKELNSLIVIDESKIENEIDKAGIIMHEEMHLLHPETMYNLNDSLTIIKTKERRLKRLIAKRYITKEKLFDYIYEKKLRLFEISEELCVPEEIIKVAFDFYSDSDWWIIESSKYNYE